MKKSIVTSLLLVITILGFSQNNEQEKNEIKKVIQTAYVEGLQNEGDAKKIESGFHHEFNLLGIDKGDRMWKYPISEWKSKQVNKRESGELPLTGNKKVSIKFKHIDVSGTAAIVKLEYYVGEKLTYIDYISLYKFDSGWKIVSKIFQKI